MGFDAKNSVKIASVLHFATPQISLIHKDKTMSDQAAKDHQQCVEKFIAQANELTQSGLPADLVSAAMMSASAVFATFSVAGNEGGLNDSGVDKVVQAYRNCVEHVQKVKKAEFGSNA